MAVATARCGVVSRFLLSPQQALWGKVLLHLPLDILRLRRALMIRRTQVPAARLGRMIRAASQRARPKARSRVKVNGSRLLVFILFPCAAWLIFLIAPFSSGSTTLPLALRGRGSLWGTSTCYAGMVRSRVLHKHSFLRFPSVMSWDYLLCQYGTQTHDIEC